MIVPHHHPPFPHPRSAKAARRRGSILGASSPRAVRRRRGGIPAGRGGAARGRQSKGKKNRARHPRQHLHRLCRLLLSAYRRRPAARPRCYPHRTPAVNRAQTLIAFFVVEVQHLRQPATDHLRPGTGPTGRPRVAQQQGRPRPRVRRRLASSPGGEAGRSVRPAPTPAGRSETESAKSAT